MPLTSLQNPVLQMLKRAVSQGRLMDDGTMPAEGPHLLAEALRSPWRVEHVFCSHESLDRHTALLVEATRKGIEVTEISARAFKTVSDTEQNQGILCLLRAQRFEFPDLIRASGPLVIMDGIQDPGNAGAIVRSAEAFGAAGVVFSEGCTRISNGKFLRAAAGSVFRVPYLDGLKHDEIIRQVGRRKLPLLSLVAAGRKSVYEHNLRPAFAMVVGSEGKGVSAAFLKASEQVFIPTRGVESLNAAIACSIALSESARQRAS